MHSTVGRDGHWKLRLFRWVKNLLGIEIRVRYRWDRYPESYTEWIEHGPWEDGRARATIPVGDDDSCWRVEIGPFLYLITEEDKRERREIDEAMRKMR